MDGIDVKRRHHCCGSSRLKDCGCTRLPCSIYDSSGYQEQITYSAGNTQGFWQAPPRDYLRLRVCMSLGPDPLAIDGGIDYASPSMIEGSLKES